LQQNEPAHPWPATSTIGELLTREGLIVARRRHRPAAHAQLARAHTPATAPNVVWTADFKGQFRIGTGAYCYPLTLLDLHTHFLLRCRALPSTAVSSARAVFAEAFAEYGLPDVLRTDNGIPFAQPNALGRLGALALWWIRLGIRPEHIRPATPSENGAHERFHRTLDADTQHPAARTFPGQQRRFDHFEGEYNFERPHASLPEHRPPGQFYTPSSRPYPATLPPLVYADATLVRRVQAGGPIKWRGHAIFLSVNLAGEDVGLTEIADDCMEIRYASVLLGEYDLHTEQFYPNVRWVTDRPADPPQDPTSPG
jgi:transposase InsO family protein